jgi:hypothetical protein
MFAATDEIRRGKIMRTSIKTPEELNVCSDG